MAKLPAGGNPAPRKKTAPAAKTKAVGSAAPERRNRVDWEAVERDYRTGKFTETELADKHGASRSAVNKHALKYGWVKDLRTEIHQATNAKLVAEMVAKEVAEGGRKVADTVLAAAEINTRVILGHRTDIQATRDVAAGMLHELSTASLLAEDMEILSQVLAGSGAEPVDEARARVAVQKALSITTRIQGVKALADTFDKLQLAERRAFSLDDKGAKDPDAGLKDMATDELQKLRRQLMGQ